MGFTYSGSVQEITEALATVLPSIQAGTLPVGTPVTTGSCSVQPGDRSAPITAGSFSVSAEDSADVLSGYRLSVMCQLSTASSDGPKVVFRSPDMFRSGSGWSETNLEIFVRAIDTSDLLPLAAAHVNLPLLVPYAQILSQAQDAAPKGITVSQVGQDKGLLTFDISADSSVGKVKGSFTASVSPDTSPAYESYIVIDLVELDLDGITGWLAEFTSEDIIRSSIQSALTSAAAGFSQSISSEIATAQAALPSSLQAQISLTLLDITAGDAGLSSTPVLGVLLNSVPDPCQALRNTLSIMKQDLLAAPHDGLSQVTINAMQTHIAQEQAKLNACVEEHQAGPHPRWTRTLQDGRPDITERV